MRIPSFPNARAALAILPDLPVGSAVLVGGQVRVVKQMGKRTKVLANLCADNETVQGTTRPEDGRTYHITAGGRRSVEG